MKIGKVPNDVLEKIVFSSIKNRREDVLTRAGIGEDCAVMDFGEYACVVSTDPITGTSHNIGRLAVHISCNDVASNGAEPIGILLTILLPEASTEEDIRTIMEEAGQAASEINVEIVGGHTEITRAVNKVVISSTVIGKQLRRHVLQASEVKVGDKILMTKMAGIEGTSIIATELEEQLKGKLSKELIKEAKSFIHDISVVKEGIICSQLGVKYMHDVTEGGILGALWETSIAVNKGIMIDKAVIPVAESTKEIGKLLSIDPLKLISSGSMVIVCDKKKTHDLTKRLKEQNILVTEIGDITQEGILMKEGTSLSKIEPPESDELYKVI